MEKYFEMKIVVYRSDKPHERNLADAICAGALAHGMDGEIRRMAEYIDPTDDTDVAVMIGVKGRSKDCMRDHLLCGKHIIYVDKGYIRYKEQGVVKSMPHLWRFSVDAFQPTNYFQKNPRPSDRWDILGITMHPRYEEGDCIMYAGKSQKYCNWWRLGDANEFAAKTIHRIRKHTTRNIIYRPKPSYKNATPIEGTIFSGPTKKIYAELPRTYCLVTHGSNASLDAIFYGIPAISLGECIANPVANGELTALRNELFFPTEQERLQWAYDMSYCQWTIAELKSGEAMQYLKEQL